MSFEDEFAPKVQRFVSSAWKRRVDHLAQYGLEINMDGEVVNDDDGSDADEDRMSLEREKQRAFDGDLGYLIGQLRKHYPLNRVDFTIPISLLGGRLNDSTYSSTVYKQLQSASDDWITPVLGLIRAQQWTGPAARSFYDGFLRRFNDACELQMACVRELTLALECYKEATKQTQDKLNVLLDNAIAEIEEDDGGIDVATVLNWVSLVATAAAFVIDPTKIGAVSLGAGATSMILSSIKGQSEQDKRELEVKGGNAEEVTQSLIRRHSEFKGSLLEFDFNLDEALRRDLASGSSFHAHELDLRRPAVADYPDEFGRLEILAAPGVPLNENPVVESIVDLHRAGRINLPRAAEIYRNAALTLDGIDLPHHSALYHSSSVAFADALRTLSGALSRTADSLEDAGDALRQVADNYQLVDDEKAEVFRQLAEMLPPAGEIPAGFPT